MSRSTHACTVLSHRVCTGISREHLGDLIAELAGRWNGAEEARLRSRRGRDRLQDSDAGPGHQLPYTDWIIVTLACLCFQQLPQAVDAPVAGARVVIRLLVRQFRCREPACGRVMFAEQIDRMTFRRYEDHRES